MTPHRLSTYLSSLAIGALTATTSLAESSSNASAHDDDPHVVQPASIAADAPAKSDTHGAPHWSYGGAEGPEYWGSLAETFGTCRTGAEQSPINLTITGPTGGDPVQLFWNAQADWTVVNNGHTIQANTDNGGMMTVDGKDFALLQFHFHTPSEHAIEGRRSDMEVHFVHKAASGELAVLGVMIEGGGRNQLFDAIIGAAPRVTGEAATGMRDPSALLPSDPSFFRYQGSLTTPPCSETVLWTVLSQPIQVSDAQIDAFQALYAMNARPLQALNRRYVLVD